MTFNGKCDLDLINGWHLTLFVSLCHISIYQHLGTIVFISCRVSFKSFQDVSSKWHTYTLLGEVLSFHFCDGCASLFNKWNLPSHTSYSMFSAMLGVHLLQTINLSYGPTLRSSHIFEVMTYIFFYLFTTNLYEYFLRSISQIFNMHIYTRCLTVHQVNTTSNTEWSSFFHVRLASFLFRKLLNMFRIHTAIGLASTAMQSSSVLPLFINNTLLSLFIPTAFTLPWINVWSFSAPFRVISVLCHYVFHYVYIRNKHILVFIYTS